MPRDAEITILVGARNTGKTTTCKKLMSDYIKHQKNGKVVIVDTFDHEAYRAIPIIDPNKIGKLKKGTVRVIIKELQDIEAWFKGDMLYNALLVFEDSRKIFRSTMSKLGEEILIDSKQKGLDVIMMYHSYRYVPPGVLDFIDNVIVFKTQDSESTVNRRTGSEAILSAWTEVKKDKNQYANQVVKI